MRRLFSQRRLANDYARIRLPCALLALASFAMTSGVATARRLVWRVVVLQAGGALLVAGLFLVGAGAGAAVAAFVGGLIAAIGSGLFGVRLFAPGIAPAAKLHRALFAAEALKWFWYVLALWVAIAVVRLAPLPLMVGLIVAQFSYWFGLLGLKRGSK
jgi:ATP synthase protein I